MKLWWLFVTLLVATPVMAGDYQVVGPRRAARAAVARIQGTWAPVPPQEVASQVAMLRRMLVDPPPSDAELAGMGLRGDDLEKAKTVRDNLGSDGFGRAMILEALAAFDAIKVEIGADHISIDLMGETQRATYTIVRASRQRVDVLLTREDGRQEASVFTFLDDGTLILMENGEEKMRFNRIGA